MQRAALESRCGEKDGILHIGASSRHSATEGERGAVSNDLAPTVQVTQYSSFTLWEKRLITYACSYSAMFSGLSSFIYYPAITALSRSLRVSIELINLTITSYQLVSGIVPSVLGDMADQSGRRPTSLLAFSLYFSANIGLAVQNDYVALVVLRCLQSAGASGTIAIAYGFIADLVTPAERGSYVGILMGFTNAAPSLGPVLGGVIAQQLSWHWIFWILSIASGIHLLCLFLFLPETARKLVGDGSIVPPRWINRSVYSSLKRRATPGLGEGKEAAKRCFHCPNPFTCLVALFQKGSFLVITIGSIQYTVYGCLAAALSTQMIQVYHLDYLTGGLIYLPCGIGGLLAALTTGRLLDHHYRVYARRLGFPESKNEAHDLYHFPLEKARLRSMLVLLTVSTAATAGFGWSLNARAHMAVPLSLQFITGSTQVAIFVICGTLLTDLNPDNSATVQASYNLIRCTLSAAGLAALQAMIEGTGVGWCFTIYAGMGGLCVPLYWILHQFGDAWRREVLDRKQRGNTLNGE